MGFSYMSSRGHASNHSDWTFAYSGFDLAPKALVKAVALLEEERALERVIASHKKMESYSGRQDDLEKLRQRLHAKGEERERCELLARELQRAGEKLFSLHLADLVYFGMDDGITDAGTV